MSDELPLAPLVEEVARLRREAAVARLRHPVLEQALTSLEESIEELQVASEELQVRTEELRVAALDLDEERRRYRDLFDLAADGYLVTDRQDLVVEANRAAGELMGRPAESLIGCRLVDLLSPASRAESARRLRLARAMRQGEAIVELDAHCGTRLAHVRYRRREESTAGGVRTHWTLTDLDRPLFESSSAPAAAEDDMLARRWLGIYTELVAVTEDLLEEAMDLASTLSRTARAHVLDSQVRPLEAHLARLRERRDHWSHRHAEVVGIEFVPESGLVRYRERTVPMTRREQQLLRFLIDRPGSFFTSRVLLARAWHASHLSEEQVRTYVARLRRKLTELELPCELVTQRPQGYALVFAEGDDESPSPSPV
ncbi:MAG TPA: winged helix-turn-helix domain-containing protein [Candidatus Dormibacteraeota bacterium]|nr:winged helix-turn-helix domain-containing protein [Candidatus Dormibacteraeota bacterium]